MGHPMVVQTWAPTRWALTPEGTPRKACQSASHMFTTFSYGEVNLKTKTQWKKSVLSRHYPFMVVGSCVVVFTLYWQHQP
jgi:hypothetical protein